MSRVSHTDKLTDFLHTVRYEDLPASVVHETKRAVLDSVGCALAGRQMLASAIVIELARRLGGPVESSIIGTDDKVASTNAAFANAQLINAQDFDAGATGHDTAAIIAAASALAEAGNACGKQLILAIALGHEVSVRLRAAQSEEVSATEDEHGKTTLNHPQIFGFSGVTLAVAACAGKLLDLSRTQLGNALGIASFTCPPNTVMRYFDMSPVRMTKYTVFGQIAQVGVQAALLAGMDYTGDNHVFEGSNTCFEFTGGGPVDARLVTENIGKTWLHRVNYKRYPGNYPTAGAKDCFIDLIEEHDIQPQEIDKISARIWPIWHRRSMRENRLATEEDYSFNVVYQLACAAYRISPARWHSPDTKADPRIRGFIRRVEFDIGCDEQEFARAKLAAPSANFSAAEITARGRRFHKSTLYRKGLDAPPEFRFTDAELIAKYKENAADYLEEETVDRTVRAILDLENRNSVDIVIERQNRK